jgi:prevent-host-death family protein
MKTVTATELRGNIYQFLDEVLETGIPLEVTKGGQRLRIIAVDTKDKLQNLPYRPKTINGDPDDLLNISWEKEIKLDLP